MSPFLPEESRPGDPGTPSRPGSPENKQKLVIKCKKCCNKHNHGILLCQLLQLKPCSLLPDHQPIKISSNSFNGQMLK